MGDLRLPLERQWFEMTKAGIKTEDYRELNEYWCRRLLEFEEETEWAVWQEFIDSSNPFKCLSFYGARIKKFATTTLTLGYPSATDADRIIQFEHAGIEIRTGNPEWGAEPGKLYFVIKHGRRIK